MIKHAYMTFKRIFLSFNQHKLKNIVLYPVEWIIRDNITKKCNKKFNERVFQITINAEDFFVAFLVTYIKV